MIHELFDILHSHPRSRSIDEVEECESERKKSYAHAVYVTLLLFILIFLPDSIVNCIHLPLLMKVIYIESQKPRGFHMALCYKEKLEHLSLNHSAIFVAKQNHYCIDS